MSLLHLNWASTGGTRNAMLLEKHPQYLVLMQTNALVHKEALLPQKAWTIIQIASLDGTSSSAFSFIDDFKVSYQTETDSPQESSSA